MLYINKGFAQINIFKIENLFLGTLAPLRSNLDFVAQFCGLKLIHYILLKVAQLNFKKFNYFKLTAIKM